jgi:RecA/RadA recombinase
MYIIRNDSSMSDDPVKFQDQTSIISPLGTWSFQEFCQRWGEAPSVLMLWGDVGTGKSTFGMQCASYFLHEGKKVFYLHTKTPGLEGISTRIFQKLPINQVENFFLFPATNFSNQTEIILNWLLQIQQLKQYFESNQVGLLSVDELVSLYLISMGEEKKNEELNQRLHFQLATLTEICTKYKIPILFTNNFSLKSTDHQNLLERPYGGKITDFWTDLEIKIERTPQSSRMKFTCVKNRTNLVVPQSWTWQLNDQGFI